jgi:hypothetical protein
MQMQQQQAGNPDRLLEGTKDSQLLLHWCSGCLCTQPESYARINHYNSIASKHVCSCASIDVNAVRN